MNNSMNKKFIKNFKIFLHLNKLDNRFEVQKILFN